MSAVNPAASPASPPPVAPGGLTGATGLGRDEFLQLLVAQIKNQDPLNPQQGHEFAAQLAQFSSVEQLIQLNEAAGAQAGQLAALAKAVAGVQAGQVDLDASLGSRMNLQAATALIGRTVHVRQPEVSWDGATPVAFDVDLGAAAREVEIVIRDAAGNEVRTMRTGALGSGSHGVTWDGALADGSPAEAGAYTVEVRATGADGAPVSAAPTASGRVDRVTVDAAGVSVWIDGRPMPFDRLVSVEP